MERTRFKIITKLLCCLGLSEKLGDRRHFSIRMVGFNRGFW